MSYSAALYGITQALVSAFPNNRTLHKALMVAGAGAMAADYIAQKQARRIREQIDHHNIYLKQAELLRREADRMRTGNAQSRYLAEEGASPDTDCFSCATAHLAGMEGALRRAAKEAKKEGGCGPGCVRWLNIAAQEPAALLARDWTPEKREKLPPEQKAVLERYAPAVERLAKKVTPTPEGEGVIKAASLLKEAVRFAEAGDGVTHPEVEARRLMAEAEIAAAERLRPGQLPPGTSQRIRSLRRQIGSGITDTGRLIEAAREADRLAAEVNSGSWRQMSPRDLDTLADEVNRIRQEFAASRRNAVLGHIYSPDNEPERQHGIPEEVIKEYTMPGASAALEASKDQIKDMFNNVVRRLEEKGIKVRYRDELTREQDYPPGTIPPGGVVEAFYDWKRNSITLGASKMAKDSYSIQSLLHEATHALLHNPECHPVVSGKPYDEMPEEGEANLVTLATMLELGIPVEDRRGVEKKPSQIKVDWERIKRRTGPSEENIRWAAQWLVRAARGEDAGLTAEKCPALRRG